MARVSSSEPARAQQLLAPDVSIESCILQIECHTQFGTKEGESFSLQCKEPKYREWPPKKDAWETLLVGVIRMKIPMLVCFGVVAPCMPTEASQKVLQPTRICKHVDLDCGGI